jgi:hypothetical protein
MALQRPALSDIVKSFVGGALMGVGVALITGGNDGLILAAIPASPTLALFVWSTGLPPKV